MALHVLTDRTQIQAAYETLCDVLNAGAKRINRSVGDASGRRRYHIGWLRDHHFWSITKDWVPIAKNALGCCIGTEDPESGRQLNITCEMNTPRTGAKRLTGGVFLKDLQGRVYLAHTGKLGGQTKGVGKANFLKYYPAHQPVTFPDGRPMPLYVIGQLSGDDFLAALAAFVRKVSDFKTLVRANRDRVSLGTPQDAHLETEPHAGIQESDLTMAETSAETQSTFDPKDLEDARSRISASIVRRRGQPEFRRALLEAYENKCAISQCDCTDALEAAHIYPYRGPGTNAVTNGLLLRSDLHTLFDLGLIRISANYKVVLADNLRTTVYAELSGIDVHLPADPAKRPDKRLLRLRRRGRPTACEACNARSNAVVEISDEDEQCI